MLPMDGDGMTLAIMSAMYAKRAKQEIGGDPKHASTGLAMYAFYDAMERTAIACIQVLDCKRTVREAYERLIQYATDLELELTELDIEGKEAASDGTGEEQDAR